MNRSGAPLAIGFAALLAVGAQAMQRIGSRTGKDGQLPPLYSQQRAAAAVARLEQTLALFEDLDDVTKDELGRRVDAILEDLVVLDGYLTGRVTPAASLDRWRREIIDRLPQNVVIYLSDFGWTRIGLPGPYSHGSVWLVDGTELRSKPRWNDLFDEP